MVPDYDDDDIVEDYEEVSSGSARRVSSGQGGPVKRPSSGARPSTTAMPALPPEETQQDQAGKGKISHKSAKMIWIICIAITVLGLAAVIADVAFDAFGRRAGGNTTPVNADNPRTNRTGLPPKDNKSPREQAEDDFQGAVVTMMKQMESSKAWDLYWVSFLEFDSAYDKAIEMKKAGAPGEELDAAWAETIRCWYKTRYASELFKHHFDRNQVSLDFFPINIQDRAQYSDLSTEQLQSADIRAYQAAHAKIDTKSAKVNKFQTDVLKYDLTASKVYQDPAWEEKSFGEYKNKWKAASVPSGKQFDQADLDFVNGPDYKEGEEKRWEAFLKEKEGG
ncbi:MAG: hypothetical protein ICCCNLDF_00437 [Planctomycetes bacterium]|nr:hypothetical protein [Planctomycetota bacterium]